MSRGKTSFSSNSETMFPLFYRSSRSTKWIPTDDVCVVNQPFFFNLPVEKEYPRTEEKSVFFFSLVCGTMSVARYGVDNNTKIKESKTNSWKRNRPWNSSFFGLIRIAETICLYITSICGGIFWLQWWCRGCPFGGMKQRLLLTVTNH